MTQKFSRFTFDQIRESFTRAAAAPGSEITPEIRERYEKLFVSIADVAKQVLTCPTEPDLTMELSAAQRWDLVSTTVYNLAENHIEQIRNLKLSTLPDDYSIRYLPESRLKGAILVAFIDKICEGEVEKMNYILYGLSEHFGNLIKPDDISGVLTGDKEIDFEALIYALKNREPDIAPDKIYMHKPQVPVVKATLKGAMKARGPKTGKVIRRRPKH